MILKTTAIVLNSIVIGYVHQVNDCPAFSYEAQHLDDELSGAGCETFQSAREHVLEQHEEFISSLPDELQEHEEEVSRLRKLMTKYKLTYNGT